jgi:hypothetical protein
MIGYSDANRIGVVSGYIVDTVSIHFEIQYALGYSGAKRIETMSDTLLILYRYVSIRNYV